MLSPTTNAILGKNILILIIVLILCPSYNALWAHLHIYLTVLKVNVVLIKQGRYVKLSVPIYSSLHRTQIRNTQSSYRASLPETLRCGIFYSRTGFCGREVNVKHADQSKQREPFLKEIGVET